MRGLRHLIGEQQGRAQFVIDTSRKTAVIRTSPDFSKLLYIALKWEPLAKLGRSAI
jgi:hypothetical protein